MSLRDDLGRWLHEYTVGRAGGPVWPWEQMPGWMREEWRERAEGLEPVANRFAAGQLREVAEEVRRAHGTASRAAKAIDCRALTLVNGVEGAGSGPS